MSYNEQVAVIDAASFFESQFPNYPFWMKVQMIVKDTGCDEIEATRELKNFQHSQEL